MEYVIIIVLELLGIGFHVMEKIIFIGNKYPTYTAKQTASVFISEDWDTLIVSGLVLVLNIVAHYCLVIYGANTPIVKWEYFTLSSFAISLFLGYAGQRVIYKYFGTTEKFIDKQINNLG